MRFSTFLLLFLFLFSFSPQVKCQNLVYDWSVEEYETCPTGLALTLFIPHWLSFRGNPDYFNTCSPDLGPLTNPFGWQHPRTGEAHMGVITFHPGLTGGREYPGVELLEPLTIGHAYDVSYYVATSYSENPWLTGRATNNLGALFMTENYLSSDELGPVPNFAHFNVDTIVLDTALWVQIKGTVLADSAYKYVAFGNFFDDSNTLDSLIAEREFTALAYYYFDDFCVVPQGGDCLQVLTATGTYRSAHVNVYPNPADQWLHIKSRTKIKDVKALSLHSELSLLRSQKVRADKIISLQTNELAPGLYILIIETEEGIAREKVVIQH